MRDDTPSRVRARAMKLLGILRHVLHRGNRVNNDRERMLYYHHTLQDEILKNLRKR